MRWSWLIGFSVFLLCIYSTVSQGNSNPCTAAATCSDCLKAGGDCYWCIEANFTQPRCNYKADLTSDGCPDVSIVIKDNEEVSKEDVGFGSIVQVRPQKITLKLRPGQKQNVAVKVKPAEDFPVKLYYLMDLSHSMEDDLQKLQSLGTSIATSLGTITKKFELGFGTFVDKNIAPFVDVTLDRPCQGCEPTFGFRHIFDFNKDPLKFEVTVSCRINKHKRRVYLKDIDVKIQDAVKQQKISGNLDTPEGGFDALMQVAVCSNELNWGDIKAARRLVVFVTDASPHIQGDGKIGGITLPNDGQCHLTKESSYLKYTQSANLDYPSIAFLKKRMKENKIVPILAVTANHLEVYQKIVKEWSDLGAKVGPLSFNSANIVELIRKNYAEIVSTARLIDNSPKNIDVSYSITSGCPRQVSERECTDLTFTDTVEFDVAITLQQCKDGWKLGDKESFQVSVPGFGDVEIEVEPICDCDCERQNTVPNSPKCSNVGNYQCGICKCPADKFGAKCQCTSKDQTNLELCKRNVTGQPEDLLCSGFGTCICGQCLCKTFPSDPWKKITGQFCECDNFGCPRYQGEICGGVSRGTCECGKCVCKPEFHGDNCGQVNCTIGAKKCLKDGAICSGNGQCDCDQCKCDTGFTGEHCERCVVSDTGFTGEHCERCDNRPLFRPLHDNVKLQACPNKCPYYLPCVLCQAFNEPSPEECALKNCNLDLRVVNTTKSECSQEVGNCIVYYHFEYDIVTQNDTVYVQQNKVCQLKRTDKDDPDLLPIILGIIAGIILLGLLFLLLWKLLITAYDNHEYQKFEKDRMKANWDQGQNPMYRPSKQQFENPTFAGLN